MTVTYTADVATCRKFGCFLTLLLRWRGSIYKLVWMDFALYIMLYYILDLIYHFALSPDQKETFEAIVMYFKDYNTLIPLSFVLGFFVSIVMTRWWDQYLSIPWPDAIALYVSAYIQGQDERARLMRRTIMRYVCLTQALVFSLISPRVKKRFPAMSHLVEVGLLLENEKTVFESMDELFPKTSNYWMPIVWASSIVTRARKEGRIRDDFAVKVIVDELNKFRGKCGSLLLYDSIPIPLVYTQVVTIAVYTFFLGCDLGTQWTNTPSSNQGLINVYLPIFMILQFFIYMGWLKVAETLINPFGEDDDDFELNWMIDRNLQVSYLIVDEMHQEHPDLIKDQYWDEVFPSELPYEADIKREEPPEQSTAKLGERLTTMSTVYVDRPSRAMVNFDRFRDVQQPQGRDELVKRIRSMTSTSRAFMRPSLYSTARQSEASSQILETEKHISSTELETDPTPKTQPSTPRQRPEEQQHRTKLLDGVYESSDSDIIQSTRESIVYKEMPEPESEEKDDFDRLKEERERERTERQKLRFVQRLGDATQFAARSRTSEHSWEIFGEEEEEEEEDTTN